MTDATQSTAPPDRLPDRALVIPGDDPALEQRPNIAREPLYGVDTPLRPIKPVNCPIVLPAGAQTIDFGRRVRDYTIQNNSAATITRELDEVATAGSLQIPPGGQINENKYVRRISIWSSGGAVVNGAATGGIVIEGGA